MNDDFLCVRIIAISVYISPNGTPYLQKALNYLDTFWNNIFACTKNGSYPIDNNTAERAVRSLTTQRNSMLHFVSTQLLLSL